MNTAASTAWLSSPLPWCACCLEHRVRDHAQYLCPTCDPKPLPPMPAPRMPLDRPTPISTTSGDLL